MTGIHKIIARLSQKASDNVPYGLRPFFRELIHRLGKRDGLRKLEAEASDLTGQWKQIISNSACLASAEKNVEAQHVLFVTGFGLGTGVWSQEPILMMSLHRRGCRVSSLFCDSALPACEFNPAGNHQPDAGMLSAGLSAEARLAICRRCSKNVRSAYPLLPIELYSYGRFLTNADLEVAQEASNVRFAEFREFEYAGIRLGEEVFASVLRATLRGTVEDNARGRSLVARYVLSGVVMCRLLERALLELRPDRVVMPHGVYLTHGVASKIANKLNIPVIVFPGFGNIRKNAIMLSHEQTYHRSLATEDNAVWDTADLTPEQRESCLAYAVSKQSGGVDILHVHPNPIEDTGQILETLGIDQSRPIISLYTNVMWDGQIFYDGNVFENILEWMFSSIEELGKNEKIWVVVRIHPGEVKGGLPTKQPFLNEIRKRIPNLPANTRVIPPESDISSYTLAEMSRAVVIYGTKLGLELAVRGIPVIVCGEAICRGKGFTIDVKSKQEYFDLLKNVLDLERLDQPTIDRAIKYAHYLYFRRMIPFPYIQTDDVTKRRTVALTKLEDLDLGKDPNLDVICGAIMNLTPPLAPG